MQEHNYNLQVFYEDTDPAKMVYHANYIRFMERARTMWVQSKGFTLSGLAKDYGVQFIVRNIDINFVKPAILEQKLVVKTVISKLKRASIIFNQEIHCNTLTSDSKICYALVNVVCTNLELKPVAIPENFRSLI